MQLPANVLQAFTALLPILFPVLIAVLIFRLGLDAHASRARIKLLEKDASSSGRLVNMLRFLEKQVDDAVADMLDDPHQSSDTHPSSDKESETLPEAEAETDVPALSVTQPVLTRTQLLVLASLNSLPQLRKHLAFIHPVRNSHAVIVSRDVKRFEHHKRGEGILRHWADRFHL